MHRKLYGRIANAFFASRFLSQLQSIRTRSAQQPPVVPQGPYAQVFDIAYHRRDARRRHTKEEVTAVDAATSGLPPTPGVPVSTTFLGLAGDFDRHKS